MRIKSIISKCYNFSGIHFLLHKICNRLFGGYILAFHNLPASLFESQIDALLPDKPVHLSEIVNRKIQGESTSGLFAITVDDGVGETVKELSKVCIRRGWPITFFVPVGYLDKTHTMAFQLKDKIKKFLPMQDISFNNKKYNLKKKTDRKNLLSSISKSLYTKNEKHYLPFLNELKNIILDEGIAKEKDFNPPDPITWSEISELSNNSLISFGSHGVSHIALSALTSKKIKEEALKSQKTISQNTNKPCEHFCYPFGQNESIGNLSPKIIGETYLSAVTMNRGRLNGKNLLSLPRIPIHDIDTINEARLKIITS